MQKTGSPKERYQDYIGAKWDQLCQTDERVHNGQPVVFSLPTSDLTDQDLFEFSVGTKQPVILLGKPANPNVVPPLAERPHRVIFSTEIVKAGALQDAFYEEYDGGPKASSRVSFRGYCLKLRQEFE